MFDIDAGKLLIIGVIALVVLGPKELPRVMRQVGTALGKMRRMASEFQSQFMDAMKESEMEDLKKDMQKMADSARIDVNYDPVSATNREIRDAIEGAPPAAPVEPVSSFDLPHPPQAPDAAAAVSAQTSPAEVPAAPARDAVPAHKTGEA
ncbi:MAG: tatB [Hyphomicrobiales bacterium]|nr:tatB [Hyphomicrobiales bacterium]